MHFNFKQLHRLGPKIPVVIGEIRERKAQNSRNLKLQGPSLGRAELQLLFGLASFPKN